VKRYNRAQAAAERLKREILKNENHEDNVLAMHLTPPIPFLAYNPWNANDWKLESKWIE